MLIILGPGGSVSGSTTLTISYLNWAGTRFTRIVKNPNPQHRCRNNREVSREYEDLELPRSTPQGPGAAPSTVQEEGTLHKNKVMIFPFGTRGLYLEKYGPQFPNHRFLSGENVNCMSCYLMEK
jgi:hypothetical protein